MALATVLAESGLAPASPYRTLTPAARSAGLDLLATADALRSTYHGSFTTHLSVEAAEERLEAIIGQARAALTALRRSR